MNEQPVIKPIIRIMVCDDHTLFRQGIKAAISLNADIEIVGEADNGSKLLSMIEHIKPDVILLDINMPIMDGIETLPKIKEIHPSGKVIIISMHNQPSMISKMIALGADAYLTKGDTAETIYEAITTVYNNKPYFTPLVGRALFKAAQESTEIRNKEVRIFSNYDYDAEDAPKNIAVKGNAATEHTEESSVSIHTKVVEEHPMETRMAELEKLFEEKSRKWTPPEAGTNVWTPPAEAIYPSKSEYWMNLMKKVVIIVAISAVCLLSLWIVMKVKNAPAFQFNGSINVPSDQNLVHNIYGSK